MCSVGITHFTPVSPRLLSPGSPMACSNCKHTLVCYHGCKMSKAFCWPPCCSGSLFLPSPSLRLFWYLSSCTWNLSSVSRCIIKIAHLEAHMHPLRELQQGTPCFQHSPLPWVFQWHPLFPVLPHSELSLCAPVPFTFYTDPSAGTIVCPSISISPLPHLRHRGWGGFSPATHTFYQAEWCVPFSSP